MSFNLVKAEEALSSFISTLKDHGYSLVMWDQQEQKDREILAAMVSLERDKIILVARFTPEERERGERKACQS